MKVDKKSRGVDAEKGTLPDLILAWEFEQYRKEMLKAQGVIE